MTGILLLLLFVGVALCEPTFDAEINYGNTKATVRGIEHTYGLSFRGIPYAHPPVGKLRFMESKMLAPTGLINATDFKSHCLQHNENSHEDCLFINVFTPVGVNLSSRLPVLFWVHGGGFVQGSGNLAYAGKYTNIINRGPLIIVSINYRLGPFGFLTTRSYAAPGNAGISDMVTALQWTKRYVKFFGGDPTKVTIGGQSSGSEAVSVLSLSPEASGLFHATILESGSAFGGAVMSYSDKTRNTTENIAINMGCATVNEWNNKDYTSIIDCLQSKSTDSILKADSKLPSHRMKWGPIQDKKFLPDRLERLALKRPNLPVLVGDVHDEWIGWDNYQITHSLNGSFFTRDGVLNSLKNSYEMTYWEHFDAVFNAAAVNYVYSNNAAPDNHIQWAVDHVMMFSEMVFIGPVLRDAKYFAYTGSPVYLYSFDYLNPNAFPDEKIPQLRGVPHGWELQYVFQHGHSWKTTPDDTITTELMGQLWTNFVVHGNPTPSGSSLPFTWPKLGKTGLLNEYVSLGPRPTVSNGFHHKCLVWVCDGPAKDGYIPPYCP